jgi:hypothetical protein
VARNGSKGLAAKIALILRPALIKWAKSLFDQRLRQDQRDLDLRGQHQRGHGRWLLGNAAPATAVRSGCG